MIEPVPDGMGFSLKPPAWLKNAVTDLFHGQTTTVPTPGGGSATITPPGALQKPGATPEPASPVDSIPGGWLTIVGAAALAFFLLSRRK